MRGARLSGYYFIYACGIRLLRILRNVQNADFERPFPERDLQNIIRFYIIRRFCRATVYRYTSIVARVVCNRPALDDAGYFEVFIESQFTLSLIAFAAEKDTYLEAGMLIFALVRGLMPVRAALVFTAKVPTPAS